MAEFITEVLSLLIILGIVFVVLCAIAAFAITCVVVIIKFSPHTDKSNFVRTNKWWMVALSPFCIFDGDDCHFAPDAWMLDFSKDIVVNVVVIVAIPLSVIVGTVVFGAHLLVGRVR